MFRFREKTSPQGFVIGKLRRMKRFLLFIMLSYDLLTEYELKEQYVYEKNTGVLL